MKNVYDGTSRRRRRVRDRDVPALVPGVERHFRYQLTVVGRRSRRRSCGARSRDNRFTIRTSAPGVKVSWQVTGIRQDAYANDHRIQVEVPKTAIEQGKYIYPQGYGESKRQSIGYQRPTPLVQKR